MENPPLERIYTVVLLDAMFFKVKHDNKVNTIPNHKSLATIVPLIIYNYFKT